MADPPNPLEEYLEQHADGRRVHKWAHYLDVYERHLAQYRGRAITMLEIGVQSGGSLRMWRDYFGPAARVVGVDIDPRCARLEDPDTTVVIGDQEDPRFMASLAERFGPFDVVIDDGGHTMTQQARTLEVLWPAIRTGGVLIVEDLHTSYWPDFGGGVGQPDTFIERLKRMVDSMHARHSREPDALSEDIFTSTVRGMHVYDSIVVLERDEVAPPEEVVVGHFTVQPEAPWRRRARTTRDWVRKAWGSRDDA